MRKVSYVLKGFLAHKLRTDAYIRCVVEMVRQISSFKLLQVSEVDTKFPRGKNNLFCVWGTMHYMYAVSIEARRGCLILWNWTFVSHHVDARSGTEVFFKSSKCS